MFQARAVLYLHVFQLIILGVDIRRRNIFLDESILDKLCVTGELRGGRILCANNRLCGPDPLMKLAIVQGGLCCRRQARGCTGDETASVRPAGSEVR